MALDAILKIIRRGTDLVLDSYDYFVLNRTFFPTNLLSDAKVLISGIGDRIGIFLEKDTHVGWSSTTSAAGAPDVGLVRDDVNTLRVTDGDTGTGGVLAHQVTVEENSDGNITMPKQSGVGIRVDPASPSFGWNSIVDPVYPRTTGSNTPVIGLLRARVAGFYFASGDICDFVFVIPNDYAPGTDLYFSIHWAHNGTNISGTLSFDVYASYAKGHNQQTFPATTTTSISYNTVDLTTTPQYQHRIEEVQISDPTSSSALFDSDDIEPDGVVTVRIITSSIPTITGGNPFVFVGKINYQSTCIGTKNKAPNFYS